MAEAGGVAGLQPNNPKFFCHKCVQEIPHVLDDFTCPICRGGFIEEVQETAGTPGGQGGHNASSIGAFDGADGFGGADFLQHIIRSLSGQSGGGGATSGRMQGPGALAAQNSYRRSRSDGSDSRSPSSNNHHFSFVINAGPGGGGNIAGGTGQNVNSDNPMENMLFSFLNDLITGLGGGATVAGLPVLSNLGDYAWGSNGLDAIVTQLMNQMEGTGPPPLPTDKIDNLPDLAVSQDQVDRKLQCSVCWDDFSLNEQVKQLECEHLYHPDCIIPWLKLHGTCPICRKDLTGEFQEDPNDVPSARFEPMNTDPAPNTDSNSGSIRSSGTTSSDSIGGRHSGQHSTSNQTSNNPSNPAASLLNQIFNPLMFGQGHTETGTGGSPSNQSGRQPDPGQPQQQRRQRDGRSQGPGGGLDNMDLDFD